MPPLDQEVALELSDVVDDAHRHTARSAGQVDAAKSEAVNTDAEFGQLGDRAGDVDGIASQAIQLGDAASNCPNWPKRQGTRPAASH